MIRYKHNKLATFLHNSLISCSKFLMKHIWLYYLLNLTWGIFLTFVGWLITLALLIVGKKPEKYGPIYCFKIKPDWGGFETGLMFVRDTTSIEHVSQHELGHTFQNAILGPFQIFIVTIPSVIRYWYREITKKCVKAYDAIWFEDNASTIGQWYQWYYKLNKGNLNTNLEGEE